MLTNPNGAMCAAVIGTGLFHFADPELAKSCNIATTIDCGHGRIEERLCRVTDDIDWLKQRHPDWVGLHSIVAITSTRTDKKTGASSIETRFYLSSLPPAAHAILAATRAHWCIENNLHWMLDVTFGEDLCQTRRPNAALNLSTTRKWALSLHKLNPAKIPIKRKIKKSALNSDFLASSLC